MRPLDPSKLPLFGRLSQAVKNAWPKLEHYLGPEQARNMKVNASHPPMDVPSDIAYWYDAAMLYANCLDTILSQLHSDSDEAVQTASRDAARVMANISVQPFTGASGYVIMDKLGNREPDYTISQLWGTELVTIINLNAKTEKFDIRNFTQEAVFVTSFDGSATWRFEGIPFLYPGNTTETPPFVVLGAQQCDFGHFYDKSINDCKPCDAGSFLANGYDVAAATECVKCSAGFSQHSPGSSSCIECRAGWHQPNEGALYCLTCEAGTFADAAAATDCTPCQAGAHQYASNASSCMACRPGFYADQERSRACRSCQPGLYTEQPARTECDACPPHSKNFDIELLVQSLGSATPMLGVNVILNSAGACLCESGYFKVDCTQSNGSCCTPCPAGGVCPGGDAMPFAAPGTAKTRLCSVPVPPVRTLVCRITRAARRVLGDGARPQQVRELSALHQRMFRREHHPSVAVCAGVLRARLLVLQSRLLLV